MCVNVSVCVFIKMYIAAQSGPVILVILCHSRVCVCVYVCLCVFVSVFIKMYITAQSASVILSV